jgi:hypothetical protein
MQGSLVTPPKTQHIIPEAIEAQVKQNPYYNAEQTFSNLIEIKASDSRLHLFDAQIRYFETALELALQSKSLRLLPEMGQP